MYISLLCGLSGAIPVGETWSQGGPQCTSHFCVDWSGAIPVGTSRKVITVERARWSLCTSHFCVD